MTNTSLQEYTKTMQRADEACRSLQLDEAAKAYERAGALGPDSFEAQLGLARTYARMRRADEAYTAAEKAVSQRPERYEGHAVLGLLHFLTDRLTEAEEELKKALELSPEDPDTHLTLAQTYADLRRFDDAERELEAAQEQVSAIEDEPRCKELLALAAHAEMYLRLAQGKRGQALEKGQEVIELEEANPHAASLAYSNLGIIEARSRHYDQAIDHLSRAYEMNHHFDRAGATLGRLLVLAGQHERAVDVLQQVMAYRSSDSVSGATRYAYAMALSKAGHREKALAQYRRSIEEGLKWPDSLIVRWRLLWLHPWLRYLLIGIVLAGVLAWALITRPSAQALTLFLVAAVLFTLQRFFGRRK